MKWIQSRKRWRKISPHQNNIPLELESTGKEIARSCGGLPLAIVVVAGLLSAVSTTQTSWNEIAINVKSSLVERCLVVVIQRKSNGKIKSCSLHDLVREMCIKISKEEKFLMHITGRLKGKCQRRISVSHSHITSFANTFSLNIRTLLYFQDTLRYFGSLRLLRVLDVLKARYKSPFLPDQFFELFHLRYLAFCYDKMIPRAISNLQSLQTLIVKVSLYHPLPHEIWNMPQLRHLVISGWKLLIPNNVPSFLSLQNLQTLGKVKNLRCSRSILNMLPNLKKLRLTFFRGSGDLLLHNLVHLSPLEKLQLELETDWNNSGSHNRLVAPSSLKKLSLIGWGRYGPYLSVGPSLPNLQVMKLIKFRFEGRVWTTIEGGFPQLKFLLLDGLNIVEWNTSSSHFPRLEVLVIRACWRLSKIPDEIGEIPTLELIELKLCSKSMADSARDLQEEKRSYGDDAFQVRCIDCEDINELKEFQYAQSLESVRKPKQVLRKPKLSYRQMKHLMWGLRPYPKPRLELDSREAELKIVDYKDAELEL